MGDYDCTATLYDLGWLPTYWNDPGRGIMPLAWGINSLLTNVYPDLFDYYYRTRTENDYFVSDASAAGGCFHPSQIQDKYWNTVTAHNKKYSSLTGITISPMVCDKLEPSDRVLDEFLKFSKDGFAINLDVHKIWKGMPVDKFINIYSSDRPIEEFMYNIKTYAIKDMTPGQPNFAMLRIVWTSPTTVKNHIDQLKTKYPGLNIEVVDPYNYFRLYGLQSTI